MRKLVGIGLCLLCVSLGCQSSPADKAREQLVGQMGVRWSAETFIEAAMNGNTKIVDLFLTAQMAPDTAGDEGRTALIWAAEERQGSIVQLLLANDANVNAKALDGTSALGAARKNADEALVAVLEQAGAQG